MNSVVYEFSWSLGKDRNGNAMFKQERGVRRGQIENAIPEKES